MKVLMLSNSGSGGARLICDSLSSNLAEQKIDVEIRGQNQSDLKKFQKYRSKFVTGIELARTRSSYGIFSTFSQSSKIIKEIWKIEPDVVHIHNWFNLLSTDDINLITKRYPTVFTMHDQRILTGGCHITYSCENYFKDCKRCPGVYFGKESVKKNKEILYNIFTSPNRSIGLICPSRWMLSKTQNIFDVNKDKTKIIHIPNPVFSFNQIRENYSDNRGKIRIIFVAANIDEPLKQLNLIILKLENYKRVNQHVELELTIVGEGRHRKSSIITIFNIGKVSQKEVIQLIIDSDLMVVPSKFENQPGVILEAMQAGTLVVAAKVGGIPELIDDNNTGFLLNLNEMNIDLILNKYLQYPTKELNRIAQNAKEYVKAEHNSRKLAIKHYEFYRNLIID